MDWSAARQTALQRDRGPRIIGGVVYLGLALIAAFVIGLVLTPFAMGPDAAGVLPIVWILSYGACALLFIWSLWLLGRILAGPVHGVAGRLQKKRTQEYDDSPTDYILTVDVEEEFRVDRTGQRSPVKPRQTPRDFYVDRDDYGPLQEGTHVRGAYCPFELEATLRPVESATDPDR